MSLKDILEEILNEYDFKLGPLFNLSREFCLHSRLIDDYPYLENGQIDNKYLEDTVEKVNDIYSHLNFREDLLLVYDNIFNLTPEKEINFIESNLINLKRKEEYSYRWFYKESQETLNPTIRLYQVEDFNREEFFREITFSDIGGDYDLVSSIYIIDLKSKRIFYFYDDRGLYIIGRDKKSLQDLWKSMPNYFFEDCKDFEIKIKKLYWIDGNKNNREDLCLHGDLEIRLNNKIVEYSSTVSAAGLKLLRSLFSDHEGGKGDHLFPCCGNTMIANKELNKVRIIGCDKGLDWSVKHEDGFVTIEIDKNFKMTYYYLQYEREVLNFIEEVENFYKKSEERIISECEIDRTGYLAFWKEWKTLKEKSTYI